MIYGLYSIASWVDRMYISSFRQVFVSAMPAVMLADAGFIDAGETSAPFQAMHSHQH